MTGAQINEATFERRASGDAVHDDQVQLAGRHEHGNPTMTATSKPPRAASTSIGLQRVAVTGQGGVQHVEQVDEFVLPHLRA